jgi:dynein heavy chain 1
MIDGEEELYKMFVANVSRNLHVVFTMNPSNPDFANRTASSPALFNRCVIDWFGDWSEDDLRQVAQSFTQVVDVPEASFTKYVGFENGQIPESFNGRPVIDPKNEALADTILNIHNSVRTLNTKLQKKAKKFNYITPRDFLDFIRHFLALKASKQAGLVE